MCGGERLKASIIIPTYQEGDYIKKTLSTLTGLNESSVEIIIVDGGSKDNTVDIARRYADKVYRLNQRGISRAKNYGAERAAGNLLIFLDADVTVPQFFMKKVYEAFQDGNVVGATCNIMPTNPRLRELIFFTFYNGLLRFLSKIKPHSRGEFIAVRREAFMAINGFNENLPCVEDHDLALRLSKLGKFIFIADLTVYETLRRMRKAGFLRTIATWLTDYLSLMLRGKPVSRIWRSIR